jgi:hypothetical protein
MPIERGMRLCYVVLAVNFRLMRVSVWELQFLSSHNHADLLVLKHIKEAVETRNSVCHSATILANALMHAGTTVDTFLRCVHPPTTRWLSWGGGDRGVASEPSLG